MTDEDRVVASDNRSRPSTRRRVRLPVPAPARRARPAGVRLVLQRRLEPDALVHPALPLGPEGRAEPRRRAAPRVDEGYEVVNRNFAAAVLARARATSPDAAVFFHDYHLYLAPRHVRDARPGRDARSTSSTSRGRRRTTGTCSRWRSASRSTRAPRERRRRVPHRCAGSEASSAAARTSSARRATTRRRVEHGAAVARHREPDLRRRARVRRARGERGRARGGARARSAPARAADRPRRSHRPVEEHRARVPRVRALPRASIPRCGGRVGMLALLDPSRQDIPEYSEYLGAIQREARA